MVQARAAEDLCGFCHCQRAGHVGKGAGHCRLHTDDNPLHCERYMDPADFALTSVEEQAQEKVARKRADEIAETQLNAALVCLNSMPAAADLLVERLRHVLHGEPQLVGRVFDVLQISEKP